MGLSSDWGGKREKLSGEKKKEEGTSILLMRKKNREKEVE